MLSSETPEASEIEIQWQNAKLENNLLVSSSYIGNDELLSSSLPNGKALWMMQKMGYKSGCGLGKNDQGVTETVKLNFNLGKRGLGLHINNLNLSEDNWDFMKEEICVKEHVNWLENKEKLSPPINFDWMIEGHPTHNVENECSFCDKEIVQNVFKAKGIFDELNPLELCQARAKANPFETIRSVFFMNRAALKIANIDVATDFMFTQIDQNSHFIGEKGPFYFADVCAGPGGFTEYILWRRQWFFKGFGLTLKDEHDFKVVDSTCISPVCFQALYGKRGDGDVCCPENIMEFIDRVKHNVGGDGVHFMMSDGGFSVEGRENIQEILSKNIYICQCLLALEIVRQHGHFVTKTFDVFTPFSVGLLYLMYLCFEKVAILKPNSSRPANSERYFICYDLKNNSTVKIIKDYLWKIVRRLWEIKDNEKLDILEIVPLEIIKNNTVFNSYILDSNNSIGRKQITALNKIAAFCRNPSLVDVRQNDLRRQCLEYWQIPDKPKIPVEKFKLDDLLAEINLAPEILRVQSREVNEIENLEITLADLCDWHFAPMFTSRLSNRCNFYAAIEFSRVYRLQGNKWIKVKDLQLVRGTLLYGEFVKERALNISNNEVTERYSLHVIDALRLGDLNLCDLRFPERNDLIHIYCKSVNKEAQSKYSVRIRPKTITRLTNLTSKQQIINRDDTLQMYYTNLPALGFGVTEELFTVNSILLLKTNDHQSFQSTYVLRAQMFINEEIVKERSLTLENLINFIDRKLQ